MMWYAPYSLRPQVPHGDYKGDDFPHIPQIHPHASGRVKCLIEHEPGCELPYIRANFQYGNAAEAA